MTDYLSVCLSNWRLSDWLTDWQTSAALVTDCRLPNWLNDCGKITHWLSDWRSLIEWLTERLSVCLSDWWIWLITYRLIALLPLNVLLMTHDLQCTFWLTDRLTDCLADWLTEWPNNRLTDQPAGRPTDWLTDWPTDWLTVTVNLYCALLSKRGYRSVYNKGRLQCRLLIDC